MLIKELIEVLQKLPQDEEIYFPYPEHDYLRTVQMFKITGVKEVQVDEKNRYHHRYDTQFSKELFTIDGGI